MSETHGVTYSELLMHNPDVLSDLQKFASLCQSHAESALTNADETVSLGRSTDNLAQIMFNLPSGNVSPGDIEETLSALAVYYRYPEAARGELPPLQAFLLAWLRQQQEPISLLNALPALHRQLYYTYFLGLSPKSAVPDKVLLQFQPDSTLSQVRLPANTQFDGGQDNRGTPRRYALDKTLWLNQSSLSDILLQDGDTVTVLQTLPERAFKATKTALFSGTSASASDHSLILGFTGLQANQTVSLYWQLVAPVSPQVSWQYWHNEWVSLAPHVTDETLSFSRSGLWTFTLPADATEVLVPTLKNAPQIAPDTPKKSWIRVNFTQPEARQKFQLTGLFANAMTATLCDPHNIDASHFITPLPAGFVIQSVAPLEGLASLVQPVPSFGGCAAETEAAFNQRIGERLHHRQRAITWSDIKSLLMARYPDIQSLRSGISQRKEQHLVVIPVPHARDNPAEPQKPKFNANRLQEMADYIKTLSNERLKLTISSPKYTTVLLKYTVTFKQDISEEWGYSHLEKALSDKFLPWIQPEGTAEISIGKSLNYYDILAALESLDYVKSVTDLRIGKTLDTLSASDTSISAGRDEVLVLTFLNPKTGK